HRTWGAPVVLPRSTYQPGGGWSHVTPWAPRLTRTRAARALARHTAHLTAIVSALGRVSMAPPPARDVGPRSRRRLLPQTRARPTLPPARRARLRCARPGRAALP